MSYRILRRSLRSCFASTSSPSPSLQQQRISSGASSSSSSSLFSSSAHVEPDFPDNASSAHKKDTGESELINRIGQPTFSTHAHLFNSVNELTPGITKSEYKSRRTRLGELLPENSVAILISGDVSHYPNTVIPHANYRQDSDFM